MILKLKKRKGVAIIELVIYALLIGIVLGVIITSTGSINKSVESDELKERAVQIDMALAVWYQSHGNKYPDNLVMMQNINVLPPAMDLSRFTYSVRNSNKEYHLEVTLPVGGKYVSPNSKY